MVTISVSKFCVQSKRSKKKRERQREEVLEVTERHLYLVPE